MITRTHNKELITDIVMTMIDDIVEDDTSKDCFVVDTEKDCWLHCVVNGEFVGLYHAVPFNRTTLDVHCYLIKDKRKDSIECGELAIKWLRDNAPSMYSKFITQTPSCNLHIKKYVEKLGFELEGNYKKAFTQNNEIHDLWLFGLNR